MPKEITVNPDLIDALIGYTSAVTLYDNVVDRIETFREEEQYGSLERIIGNDDLPLDLPQNVSDLSHSKVDSKRYNQATETIAEATNRGNLFLDETDRRKDEALEHIGIDDLTKLINQGTAYKAFREIFIRESFKEHSLWMGVLHIDLDDFQIGNNTHGHPAMDEVLRNNGNILNETIKSNSDAAIRIGGEELAIYCVSRQEGGIHTVSEKLRQKIAEVNYEFGENDEEYQQTVSIGYITFKLFQVERERLKEIYDSLGSRIKKAKNSERSNLIRTRDEAADRIIKPIFDKLIKNAEDASYESKLRGKDRVSKFEQEKEEIGYYAFVRDLYVKLKAKEIGKNDALKQADNYLQERRLLSS